MERFRDIIFDEDIHKYTLNGKILKSCTGLISQYQKPFDLEKMLPLSAKKEGIDPEELRKIWKEKNTIAINKGNRQHNYLEKAIHGTFIKNDILPKEKEVCNSFLEWYRKEGYIPVASECLIGNDFICGKFDHLAYKDGEYIIFDYKTNENLYKKAYNNLLYPLMYLPDTKVLTYSLQLNIYENLLQIPCKKKIVYLKEDAFEIIDIPDMHEEVNLLFEDYKSIIE
jgi:hypothetical protein